MRSESSFYFVRVSAEATSKSHTAIAFFICLGNSNKIDVYPSSTADTTMEFVYLCVTA